MVETQMRSVPESEEVAKHRKKVENAFYIFQLDTPLGTPESSRVGTHGYLFPRYLSETKTNRAKTRSALREVFSLLDVKSYKEVVGLIHDPEKKAEAKTRAHANLAEAYSIPDIESALERYGEIADNIIQVKLKTDILQQSGTGSQFELSSEVADTHDPVELALIIFDRNLSRRRRFEAKRKLLLMEMAAQADKRGREVNIQEKSAKFDTILNAHVWDKGDYDQVARLSTHNPNTFACIDVEIKDKKAKPEKSNQRVEVIDRRRFKFRKKFIPAFVRPRNIKDPEAEVLKQLIRGEKNPETAVHDQIGLMVVLDSVQDVEKFEATLMNAAGEYGSFIKIDEEESTLTEGERENKPPGSSEKYKNHNFHVLIGGVAVEVILHTNESYLNSEYEVGNSHREYAISRAFDSGVVGLLFPPEIYGHESEDELKKYALETVRQKIAIDLRLSKHNSELHKEKSVH